MDIEIHMSIAALAILALAITVIVGIYYASK